MELTRERITNERDKRESEDEQLNWRKLEKEELVRKRKKTRKKNRI